MEYSPTPEDRPSPDPSPPATHASGAATPAAPAGSVPLSPAAPRVLKDAHSVPGPAPASPRDYPAPTDAVTTATVRGNRNEPNKRASLPRLSLQQRAPGR